MISKEIVNTATFITIENNEHLKVVLSSLGASVFAIYYDEKLMTLSLENKEDYFNSELYHGKTIGPVCGRIKDGQIENYHYELNEDGVTRHGGPHGLSTRSFDYKIEEKTDTVSVIFELNDFVITYTLSMNKDDLMIEYRYEGEAQPVSLTNHTFFHLGDSFNKLQLRLNADYFVENDAKTLVPLKKRGLLSCLNFKACKNVAIGVNDPYLQNSRAKGYDHYLHFTNKPFLVLNNNFYELWIATNFSGVLLYSDNYDFKEKTIDNRTGTQKALAVEPQDSPLERQTYSKDKKYYRFMIYSFYKKGQ